MITKTTGGFIASIFWTAVAGLLSMSAQLQASQIEVTNAAGEALRFQTNMPKSVTEVGKEIYNLHMYAFWWCVVIGVITFGVMFYSIIKYRKSRGHEPATFHENIVVELVWTIIPFIILAFLAWPAIATLEKIYDTKKADLDILITGYQWKWKYEYLDEGENNISFFSTLKTPQSEIYNEELKGEHYLLEVDEPLVVPVGKKIRFLVTAYDVLHSWWVPDLAVKRDAIPGFVHEAWAKPEQEGIYRGQCAELCGKDHGFMPIEVRVVSEQAYRQWKQDKQAEMAEIKGMMEQSFSMEEMMQKGKEVYDKACASCHMSNGEGIPGAFPALKGSRIALGDRKAHIEIVVNGKPGTAMSAFGEQLNDVDLAAVITYERNAWGNNMGDIVQPIDVFNFKKNK